MIAVEGDTRAQEAQEREARRRQLLDDTPMTVRRNLRSLPRVPTDENIEEAAFWADDEEQRSVR